MSSQRRQIMQPWPLCLVSSISKNKDRSILPKYYTRVPTLSRSATTSSSISQDCASNTTLLTNASPFNSQQALISDKKSQKSSSSKTTINNSNNGITNLSQSHYYADNLRHENDLKKGQIYNPLIKDRDRGDYKQLEQLISKERIVIEDSKMLMDSQLQMEQKNDIELQKKNNKIRSRKGRSKLDIELVKYPSQVLAALTVSLGSMVVGFSCSYSSPAIDSMKQTSSIVHDEINTTSESWIGSILPLFALFGGIAGGPFIEYLGRRNTILATAFPFIVGWLSIAMAQNVSIIYIGRAICGFCVGVASLSLPVYLGETIQAEVRGTLGLLPTAFGNIGILFCYTAGMYLDWSKLAYLGAILPLPYLALMFRIPETPGWYISKGKVKQARKSLQWLRGKNADISDELASIEDANANSEKQSTKSPIAEMLKKKNLKPLLISLGLMFFQQFSGINAVIFYTVKIFELAGSSIPKNISTIIIGIVNFASTFIATGLIDRLGRKVLLYISTIAMITTLFILGAFFYLKENQKYYTSMPNMSDYGWVPLTSLVIYVIGFSLGFGPIPWLMMGEILPASIRGPAASVATAFNWFIVFTVTKTFQEIMSRIGAGPTFWIFCTICCVALVFVKIWVPETRGRSLEEIEKGMSGPVRRMSAVANMKPMPAGC